MTITMIVEMIIQNPNMIVFGNHQGKQGAGGHENITSCQHLENGSRQLD